MLTPPLANRTVRGAAFALWALAAASAVFWGLKLGGGQPPLTLPAASMRPVAAADPAAVARLLGGAPAAGMATAQPTLASRFQLLGVAAGVRSGAGAAIIAVDGKAGKPYRVGSMIEEGIVLQSVQGRRATLAAAADGPPLLTLELPPPPK